MATRDDELGPLERLVDQPGDHAAAPWVRSRAVELVESLEPLRLSSGGKQRLLLSLGQGWVRRRFVWLRPVIVGILVLGSGAIASAALTNWPARLVRSCRTLISSGETEPSPAVRAPAPRAIVTTDRPAPESTPPAPPRPSAPVRRPASQAHSRRPLPGSPADDPALLIDATRALRVEKDPKLARALAGRYLERHPTGALADEALAISIEAAVNHHDADAADLGARYLVQFPRGAFRGLAERTLTGGAAAASR